MGNVVSAQVISARRIIAHLVLAQIAGWWRRDTDVHACSTMTARRAVGWK